MGQRCVAAAVAGLAAALWVMPSSAQTCASVFDEVRAGIETDYVGFAVAIAPSVDGTQAYHAFAAARAAEASNAVNTDCTPILNRFISYFGDPHVFLSEQPELSATETAVVRASAPRQDVDAAVELAWARRRRDYLSIAGAWAAPEFDVVVRPVAGKRGEFVAMVVETRDEAWTVGDVAARFRQSGASFEATLYRAPHHIPVRIEAVIQRNVLLHMAPLTWGRIAPLSTRDRQAFAPRTPRAPTFAVLSETASLLSIPSFSPEHSEELATLLTAHAGEMRARRLLVLDLRGNEGGSAGLGVMLAPYYYSANLRADTGPRPYPSALSSARMRRYFGRLRDNVEPGAFRDSLDAFVPRLEAAPGQLVPFYATPEEAAAAYASGVPEVVYESPAHVAIIVDRHVVSAGEAVLLEARRSPRVTVFGKNTGGSIDYQNVAMFAIGEGQLSYYFGMPTMAASDELPAKGFNAAGVPVDVRLRLGRDWVASVERHYRRRRRA